MVVIPETKTIVKSLHFLAVCHYYIIFVFLIVYSINTTIIAISLASLLSVCLLLCVPVSSSINLIL